LSNVSLDLAPGEFVAVAGPSGCGKTTLLLCAGALLSPDAGMIAIDGQQPYDLSPEGRARFRATHVGFVFQQFHLVPYLCVLDNVPCGHKR
jgi:ABC-type lipoprotein export system ATPase subunit